MGGMTQSPTLSGRIWAELLLLGLIWGGSFLAIRTALDEIAVATAVAHRVFWAAAILWVVVLIRRRPLPRSPRTWAALAVMGVLNNVVPFSLMAWGQLHIESGLASVFNAATAIFGVLAAALFLADERLTLRRSVGIGLGFAGVAVAIGLDSLRSFDITALAQLAVIGGTVSYALAGVWSRLHLRGLPPDVSAAGMLTGAALVMGPAALLLDGAPRLDLAPATLAGIGYYAVVATAGAYLLYFRIIRVAGSGNTMLVTLLIPPVAIVLGAQVRGETLGPNVFAGLALLAVGLLILDGRVARRRARVSPAGP